MNLNKTRSASFSNFEVTLRGDGSIHPELQFHGARGEEHQAIAYVGSENLREMAKQLNKWADKLDKHEAKANAAS